MTHESESEPAWLDGPLELRLHTQPTYWRCEPSWSWRCTPPLAHHLLWCVLDGVGELTLDGRTTPVRAGTCAVFAPGDAPHGDHDPARRLVVFGMHFTAHGPAGEPARGVAPPGRWGEIRDRVLLDTLARRCDTAARRGDAFGRDHAVLCLRQILTVLWEDLLHPEPDPADAALDELVQSIRLDPGRRWTVAEMAAQVRLSRAQFSRRFTARAGTSPARYAIRARVDRARRLLAETDLSVTQISRTLGYADVAHFSRQFTQHTGHPPRETRQFRA